MKIYIHSNDDISAVSKPVLGFAVIDKKLSGLDYDIWLDPAGKDRNTSHRNFPRLKVRVGNERIPFSIGSDPKPLLRNRPEIPHQAEILRWISQNSINLLKHYNKEISDKEILDKVERLK